MKLTILLLMIIVYVSSCNNSHNIDINKDSQIDTIYGGDIYPADKKISIHIDNGINSENLIFKIQEPTLVRITVPRLSKYKIYPSEIKGADIIKVDTSDNYFLIIPKDSVMNFTLNQYYDTGKVIIYHKKYNNKTNSFEVQTIPQNGFKIVGEINLLVK